MAVKNPTSRDFMNNQQRALDYQQYRSTSDILRAVAQFYKVSVFRTANDKPLYYITSGLNTNASVIDDKIQITVNKGTLIIDNQPIVFLDDFDFEYDKPNKDITYYVYIHYKYVEEYPPNYAEIEIYTSPINEEGYFQLSQVKYKADTDTVTVIDFSIKNLIEFNKASLLENMKLVDGAGSGLDADLLDGKQASYFANTALSNVGDKVLLNKIKKVDGSGSGLDADLLDGKQATDFADVDLSNVTDSDILNKIKKVDGSGSGLDADLLDGKQAADFADNELSNVEDSVVLDKVKAAGLSTGVGGDGYRWTSPSRSANVTYTNTTGNPIEVAVTISPVTYGGHDGDSYTTIINATIYVNNNSIGHLKYSEVDTHTNHTKSFSFIVPTGNTYRISLKKINYNTTTYYAGNIELWKELVKT